MADAPLLLIDSGIKDEALFAVFASGLVRHIGGVEAGHWEQLQVPHIHEVDRSGYFALVRDSFTAWRPADWPAGVYDEGPRPFPNT